MLCSLFRSKTKVLIKKLVSKLVSKEINRIAIFKANRLMVQDLLVLDYEKDSRGHFYGIVVYFNRLN